MTEKWSKKDALAITFFLVGALFLGLVKTRNSEEAKLRERGRELAAEKCGKCHTFNNEYPLPGRRHVNTFALDKDEGVRTRILFEHFIAHPDTVRGFRPVKHEDRQTILVYLKSGEEQALAGP